ncbi:hypothetical protein ACQ4PT_034736 [Festuca glaucescens]
MKALISKKAQTVQQRADPLCKIWYICKGTLVYRRKAIPLSNEAMQEDVQKSGDQQLSVDRSTRLSETWCVSNTWLQKPNIALQNERASPCRSYDNEKEFVKEFDEPENKFQCMLRELDSVRKQAYEEICSREKAERELLEAFQKARDSENLYFGEAKRRNEIEENLTTTMEEVERLTQTTDKLWAKLQEESKKRLALEKRTAHSYRIIKDLMLQCDKAVREVEALHAKKGESSAAAEWTMHITEISCSEITEATNNFDHALKVGESVYGSVYRGFLQHTHVAIKKLNFKLFNMPTSQVEILSRVRHPNLVTLIGACKEDQALVYEYMPNGSLDDRLACKNNSKPLGWQLRTRIISDVCSALIFLHSNKPHSIVHSDLKASNIILDGNNVAKLSGFGVCRMFTDEFRNTTTLYRHTHPKGSFVYIDPEYVMTGDLTPQSDVYSFGIVLLRLLTGRPGFGLLKDVQQAVEKDCLAAILDSSAGDWPAMQAEQLARVGLRCCEIRRKNRPDLRTEGATKMDEEEVHIAVGKNFRKEKANILWAAANFPTATIVLVNVHWPSKWMPFMGSKVPYKYANEKEKEMHRSRETETMVRMLSRYKSVCNTREVRAHYLTHDDILAGLVNLVKKLKIKRIVIGSRNMSKQEVLRKCCQIWVVLNGKYMSTSNDHLKHTGSTDCGGSSELLASTHELSNGSDGYTTPASDFVRNFLVKQFTHGNNKCFSLHEAGQENEESNAYAEVEFFPKEGADQSDEIHSCRNATQEAAELMEEMEKLQGKLKDLQDEGHNYEENILSPRKKNVLLNEMTLSKKRCPELQIREHIVQFSVSQIGRATNNFSSQNFIGEGGYGPVYKGKLGGVPVAIKLLRPRGSQGFPEFQQEVVVLSRIEHPHIVRLIGVCQESCALVYEHLPNGTLKDGLSKGLPWRDRIRVLAEQRSALAHLHSSRPYAIIHADLKLANILLDARNVSRLGDFGTARVVHMKPLDEDTVCRRTNPMGTIGYMDPVFLMTGELTTESDVYAFGVVILQVLTGLVDLNIAEQVREAMKMDAVHGLLDASAGSWPELQAERLLQLALRCCHMERKRRPTITSDADWRSLEILRTMSTASKSRRWSQGS